jgi:hypothetical protein
MRRSQSISEKIDLFFQELEHKEALVRSGQTVELTIGVSALHYPFPDFNLRCSFIAQILTSSCVHLKYV